MKKGKIIIALLMVAVMTLSLSLFVACNKDTVAEEEQSDSTTIEATEGLIISNGDFKVVDTESDQYPLSVTDWSGASQYSSGSFNTDVIAGVISLEEALYEANKSEWNDDQKTIYNLLKTGKYGDDDKIKNALMIYMPEEETVDTDTTKYGPTAYGYTSSSFTLEKASYYKVSVDVLTYNINGKNEDKSEYGARIYLSSNTYAEFSAVNTNGAWKTYEIVIETSPSSSTSLSILLGLGKYTSYYTEGLTTGYAFFDGLTVEKLESETDKTYGATKYAEALVKESNGENVQTATLKVPNGRFNYGATTVSSTAVPSNWSLVTGNSSEDDKAPTSLGTNGIIDLSKFASNYSSYSGSYTLENTSGETITAKPATLLDAIQSKITNQGNVLGSNVYMLSQQLMTAQGIKSTSTITIEKNKTYALSVNLYTYDIHGAGVSLILTSSDSKDIVINGISSKPSDKTLIGRNVLDENSKVKDSTEAGATTDGWTTYTFYIKANEYKDYKYNMTIWLGTEGTNANTSVSYYNYNTKADSITYKANGTFSNGWVFIDELKLEEVSSIPSEAYVPSDGTMKLDVAKNSSKTALSVNLSSTNKFEGTSNSLVGGALATSNPIHNSTSVTALGTPNDWSTIFDTTETDNPIISAEIITAGLVNIADEASYDGKGTYPGMPYDISTQKAYMIYAAKDTAFSVDSAPISLTANNYYRFSVWAKTVGVKSTSGASIVLVNDEKEVSSFTSINTDDYDDYTNDWCEYTFIICPGEDNADFTLRFKLGSGTRWETDTLTSGALFIANMDLENITYSVFSGTSTGTYVKSYDLSTSKSYTFTNGGFDDYDKDDENLTDSTALKEQEYAATPENWTITDETLKANEKDGGSFDLIAGIIALEGSGFDFDDSTQTKALFGDGYFDDFYTLGALSPAQKYTADIINKVGGPNMLAISSVSGHAVGFNSDSKSLSANSFYKISVWAKVVGTSSPKASIYLTSDSSVDTSAKNYFQIAQASDWTQYTFYIKTGITSTDVKVALWLGYNTEYIEGVTEADAKSTGAVFFDNVTYFSISEDDYKNATTGNIQKLSYSTETFDSFTTSTSTRESLTSPTGWTGSTDTDQDSDNTIKGIAYTDEQFYKKKSDMYVDNFGKELDIADITVLDTDEDYIAAAADAANAGKGKDAIVELVKEARLAKLKAENWLPVSALDAYSGKSVLAINNIEKSAYKYSNTSFTMSAESYYKVSVMIKTYLLNTDEGAGAYIVLDLGSAEEEDKPLLFEKINTNGVWTKYTFYVETLDSDVTSAQLNIYLGKYTLNEDTDEVTGLTSGYLFIDDVSIELQEDMTDQEFADAAQLENTKTRTVTEEETGTADDEEDDNNVTETSSFNLEYLWWMIPTIILGLLIIAVVVVWAVKKFAKPYIKKREKALETKADDNFSLEAIDEKHDRYNQNKE